MEGAGTGAVSGGRADISSGPRRVHRCECVSEGANAEKHAGDGAQAQPADPEPVPAQASCEAAGAPYLLASCHPAFALRAAVACGALGRGHIIGLAVYGWSREDGCLS